MKKAFLALVTFSLLHIGLFGTIEQFFKKPSITSKNNQVKHIDFIYTINLDRRPEKFASCVQQLEPYNITPYRFSAVNGWELSFEALNSLGVVYTPDMNVQNLKGTYYLKENNGKPTHEVIQQVGKSYFSHCLSRGCVGILLSHLSVLQHAFDAGFSTIWVMEDDIQVIKNPHLISTCIERLDFLVGKGGWDILFTDKDTKNKKGEYIPCMGYARRPNFTPDNPQRFSTRQDINGEFTKIGARYGAYSMIVRRSGMKKILNFLKKYNLFLPYDMEFYLPNDMRLYAVTDDIVSTKIDALSDNGAPRYLNTR